MILRNFVFDHPDCFIIFSNSGINEVVVDVALELKLLGLPIIAVVSVDHCTVSAEKLTALGEPPIVLTSGYSGYFIDSEASKKRFDDCYDDYRARVQKNYEPAAESLLSL